LVLRWPAAGAGETRPAPARVAGPAEGTRPFGGV